MKKEKILLTKIGLMKLKKEYEDLTKNQRLLVIKELKRSRDLGDLSENGAYAAAREKQSFIEGRIRELENIFKNVQIVDKASKNVVSLGTKVLLSTKRGKVMYEIVGHGESDFSKNRISHDSPLGIAIVGKKKGDLVIVKAPSGDIEYTIVDIK